MGRGLAPAEETNIFPQYRRGEFHIRPFVGAILADAYGMRPYEHHERSYKQKDTRRCPFCFGWGTGIRVSSQRCKTEIISALLRSSVSRGSDSPQGCHSLPLLFKSLHCNPAKRRGGTMCYLFFLCLATEIDDIDFRSLIMLNDQCHRGLFPFHSCKDRL